MEIIFNIKTIYNSDITKVLACAQEMLCAEKKSEVCINYVTEAQIRQLNSAGLGNDRVTDVLTFPFLQADAAKAVSAEDFKADINPQTGNLMLGEIYISRTRARYQAAKYGHSQKREMAYLALHGFLHILGYDHMTDSDKTAMRAAEERIMSACGISRDD